MQKRYIYDDTGIREMTPEEIKEWENWEHENPVPAPITPIEDRVADIELMLADLIGGAV